MTEIEPLQHVIDTSTSSDPAAPVPAQSGAIAAETCASESAAVTAIVADASGPESAGSRRSVRPRDWLALGVAIGLVMGLGIGVLLARNNAGEASAAAPAQPSTITMTVSPSVDAGTSDSAGEPTDAPATRAPTPGVAGDDGVGQSGTGDSDVAASVIAPSQPTLPTAGEKAGPIGPLGDMAHRIDGDPLALGDADAPVVMVMYSDYRCPFCALFSQQLEPQIIERYVDAGQLRVEWRDFPIFGDDSERAAVAGRAAAKQGLFWEFNRALYAAAPSSGHPDLPDSDLIAFAREADVPDIAAFTADLDDPELAAAVRADFDEGSQLGVPATPSFIINGYPLRGAQPLQEFIQLIDTVIGLQDGDGS